MAVTRFHRHRVRADGAIEQLVSVDQNRDGKPNDGGWNLDEVTSSEVGMSVALERTTKSRAIERTGSMWHRYGGETNYITFDYDASGELTSATRYINSKLELWAQIERRCDGFDVMMRTSHKPDEVFARFRFTGGACELNPERIDWMMRQFFVKTLL